MDEFVSKDVREGIAVGGALLSGVTWIVVLILLSVQSCERAKVRLCIEGCAANVVVKDNYGNRTCDCDKK